MEDRLISRCLPSRAHFALRCLVFLQPRVLQCLLSWSHLGHFLSLASVLPLASTQSRQASLRLPCKQISPPKQVVHREALTLCWQRKWPSEMRRRRPLATCCSDDHRQQRTPQSSTRSKLMARGRLWQKRPMHAAVVHRVAKRGRTFGSAFSSSCSAAARGLPMGGTTCGECGWMKVVGAASLL